MNYEYKEMLQEMVESYIISESEELKMKVEIDHVYTQAAKADEYEAKAKAWDNIKAYIIEELRGMRLVREEVPFAFSDEVEALNNILDTMAEYESGDYDA